MVVFEREMLGNNTAGRARIAIIGTIIKAHYAFLLTIIKIESKKQLDYLHYLVAFILYVELCFFLLWFHDNLWTVFIYALIGEFLGLLLFFENIPIWKDEQTELEMKEYYKNSDDPFYNFTYEEIIQLKTAEEITKQPINTGGKNTEITIDYEKIDLNKKYLTIIVPKNN